MCSQKIHENRQNQPPKAHKASPNADWGARPPFLSDFSAILAEKSRGRPNSSPVRPQKLKIGLFCIIFHAEHAQTTLNPSNPSRTRDNSKSSLLRPIHLAMVSFCIIFHAEHDKTTLNPSTFQNCRPPSKVDLQNSSRPLV